MVGADECADVVEVECCVVVVIDGMEGLDGDFLIGVEIIEGG